MKRVLMPEDCGEAERLIESLSEDKLIDKIQEIYPLVFALSMAKIFKVNSMYHDDTYIDGPPPGWKPGIVSSHTMKPELVFNIWKPKPKKKKRKK